MKTAMPPIWVINLERSKDRRVKMQSQLERHELAFEFVPGVEVANLSKDEISSVYDPAAAFNRLGRELHLNEMACSWAHIRLYERIVQERIPEVVILEDDVDLADEFAEVLSRRSQWLPADWRLVNFAHDMAEPVPLEKLWRSEGMRDLWLCHFESVVGRTGAYMVSLSGAESLLRHAFPIRMPLDDLAGNSQLLGGPVYGVTPRVATWDGELPSEIWTDSTRDAFAERSRSGMMGLFKRIRRRLRWGI